ncbi:aldo/keto reductase [Sanguibacter suaedae]|uniref:Aldo/keto reductase n=1 Tax=Sanguibacter suaedae TaxID=2795737 RepID=A0A934MCD2_9MICO|nr:aldo/keto reductase [Sanguibacter suaedae]MBI9113759.1 aldo/keto reductase [Sanguibacter suaedae]
MSIPTHTLHDGTTVPAIGFGTAMLKGARGVDAVVSALDEGYRLIDSAFNYENEGAVGEAVRRTSVPRDEILVSTKLAGRHHAHDDAVDAVHESLYRTGLDHLDLVLIHWPNPSKDLYVEAWQALLELQQQGVVRSVGVSNFLPDHLDRLVAETGVAPVINQVELHPYFPQAEQREADARLGVRTESWSPLGRAGDILDEPILWELAHAHGLTVPQLILRWHVQLGSIPLPKATSRERQRENLGIFDVELTDDEMALVTALGRPDGRNNDQDPAVYEEF